MHEAFMELDFGMEAENSACTQLFTVATGFELVYCVGAMLPSQFDLTLGFRCHFEVDALPLWWFDYEFEFGGIGRGFGWEIGLGSGR
jgi:hypothetical protein